MDRVVAFLRACWVLIRFPYQVIAGFVALERRAIEMEALGAWPRGDRPAIEWPVEGQAHYNWQTGEWWFFCQGQWQKHDDLTEEG